MNEKIKMDEILSASIRVNNSTNVEKTYRIEGEPFYRNNIFEYIENGRVRVGEDTDIIASFRYYVNGSDDLEIHYNNPQNSETMNSISNEVWNFVCECKIKVPKLKI